MMPDMDPNRILFDEKREHLKNNPPESQDRQFILDAITVDHPYYSYYLEIPPGDFEDDIKKASETYDTVRNKSCLRIIRRFLYRRYAFGAASQLETKLKMQWWRVWFDRLMPRIGLSLILGFGAVLGASDLLAWLGKLNCCGSILLCIGSLIIIYNLIRLNVRDRIGEYAEVQKRARPVFAACLIWVCISLLLGRIFGKIGGLDECGFDWTKAANTGAVALTIAILAQFFFSRSGSIADPL